MTQVKQRSQSLSLSERLMDDHNYGKDVIDLAAASTGILSMVAWLPPTASLFTIVWLGIRIWETKTIQKIINNK